jgi:glucose-6-phosphate-specific signal transduction histidine kinase
MAARKDMLTQQKLQYVRTLAQLLPGITDRASAIAAARILSPLAEDVYSHINLLQHKDITRQIDTLPIRRHLKRITRERFFDSHELAELLRERNSPSGPNSYQAPVDDVEEEDIEDEEDDDIDVDL